MTTPPGDDSLPDADADADTVPSARSDDERVRASAPEPTTDGTALPKPPQAWFTPPQVTPAPEPTPAEPASSKGLGQYVGVLLIGAAALLLLSVFLPWTTWRTPDLGRGIFGAVSPPQGHATYGLAEPYGQVVVLAGMAALGLALAGRAVHHRFNPYAAIPGALSLLAVLHRGMTLGDSGVIESITWGFWIAVIASVAVLALGLAGLAREDQS